MIPDSEFRLALDVHGVHVLCTGDREACEALGVHFAAYVVDAPSSDPAIRITLQRSSRPLPIEERTVADQVVDRGVVYNRGATTIVDHHGRALSVYDFERERGEISALDVGDLVELGYLMVHSRVGAHLERLGLVRLHAVSFAVGDRAAVVLAPSGGGKSTLARALLRTTDARLLGDDLVLIDVEGKAHAFHSPIGLTSPEQAEGIGAPIPFERRLHTPKWIIPLEEVSERLEAGPYPVELVVLAQRVSQGPSRLVPIGRRVMWRALFRDMVVGLGLPQVLELVARRGARDLPSQLPSALRRTRAAAAVIGSARGVRLELADPEEAAALLVQALETGGSPR